MTEHALSDPGASALRPWHSLGNEPTPIAFEPSAFHNTRAANGDHDGTVVLAAHSALTRRLGAEAWLEASRALTLLQPVGGPVGR